jgi:hypothetical protein
VNASTRHTHTPGPWMASQAFFFGHDSLQITGTNGDTSPFLCRLIDDTPDYAANARLIAAAPTMLAACMSALRALEDNLQPGPMDEDAKEGLRAAIARATGGNAS